jgi:hypothetical protein
MNNTYFFDRAGVCILVRAPSDQEFDAVLALRINASAFVAAAEQIPIERARLVDGAVKEVDPVVAPDAVQKICRGRRDLLLIASDWTQLPDVPLPTKQAWATYRQALRDITDQPGFPLEVVWPEPPS